jgi:hypothetical protein
VQRTSSDLRLNPHLHAVFLDCGREARLRYVLRPPIAQERVEQGKDGRVRITLKKAYADGTVAVDMDPLWLLCRLATSVPPPRFHTIHYAGVLAPASQWRSRLAPAPRLPAPAKAPAEGDEPGERRASSSFSALRAPDRSGPDRSFAFSDRLLPCSIHLTYADQASTTQEVRVAIDRIIARRRAGRAPVPRW